MGPLEDPIFDPWSGGEATDLRPSDEVVRPAEPLREAAPAPGSVHPVPGLLAAEGPPSGERGPSPAAAARPQEPLATVRRLGMGRLEALAKRLRLARHEASLTDQLEGPARLIRFELKPWRSPLAAAPAKGPAVLEIGLDAASDDMVMAWYWLDDVGEAPYKTATVSVDRLTAGWIDHAALDFVAKALERG